jgi:hypothetical protein
MKFRWIAVMITVNIPYEIAKNLDNNDESRALCEQLLAISGTLKQIIDG